MQVVRDAWTYWLKSLRTEATRRSYSRAMTRFLEYVDLTADQVFSLRKQQFESKDFYEETFFETKVRDFLSYVRDTWGPSEQSNAYYAVQNFFRTFHVKLELDRGDAPKKEPKRPIRAIRKTEIRSLLKLADYRERALLLFLKDTGLSRVDTTRIRLGMFEPDKPWTGWQELFTADNAPLHFRDKRKKTGVKFLSFLGPESIEALSVYLRQREKGTTYLYMTVTKGVAGLQSEERGLPPETLSKDSYLFRNKTNFDKVHPQEVTKTIGDLVKMSDEVHGVSAHSFRKFFQTTLESPALAIEANWIRKMMGHKAVATSWDVPGHATHPAYSDPEVEELRVAYRMAEPELQVEASWADFDSLRSVQEEVSAARAERDTLKDDVELLKETIKELLRLREQRKGD